MRLRVVVCAMLMSVIAGCGGGGRPGAPTASPTPTALVSATRVAQPVGTATGVPSISGGSETSPAQPAIVAPVGTGGRVAFGSGAYFLLGANYPWINYGNDIGSNAFGSYGFHTGGAYAADFSAMAREGVHVARLFAFADGRALRFDTDGTPAGVSPDTFADLDATVALARANNVYLDIVLLDFSFFFPATFSGGVQMGGHTDVFADAAKRDALVSNVIAPVINRYANEPYVLSWELMNEPEWAISDLPQAAVNKKARPVTMEQFWAYGGAVAAIAHAAGSRVTVGSASLKWNKVWTPEFAAAKGLPDLGLDYYQTHYYPWMDGLRTNDSVLGNTTWSPKTQSATALGLDKPIVVGEAPDAPGMSDTVWDNGYAGYWPWSYRSDKTSDHFSIDPSFAAWEAAHADAVRIPAP